MAEKKEEGLINIEEVQDSFKEQLQMHLRTTLSESKYNKLKCAFILTNDITGKLDVVAASTTLNLVNDVKGILHAALDQLNRIQLVHAITGFMLNKQTGGKKKNV